MLPYSFADASQNSTYIQNTDILLRIASYTREYRRIAAQWAYFVTVNQTCRKFCVAWRIAGLRIPRTVPALQEEDFSSRPSILVTVTEPVMEDRYKVHSSSFTDLKYIRTCLKKSPQQQQQ